MSKPLLNTTPAATREEAISLDAEITELAQLKSLEYDRVREARAKELGVRVGTLDKAVEEIRSAGNAESEAGQGKPLTLHDPEPWPEPVKGVALLTELSVFMARHLVLSAGAADTLALWTVFTYCHEVMFTSPLLAILSPERRCGKTTLVDILKDLVRKGLAASAISPSALYRTIEKAEPTLLIDEADTFMAGNEDLRGILNSGHTKAAAFVIKCVGDELEPRTFSTWAPKAIAMIGKLPSTLMDRSILVPLRRKLPGEKITRFRAGGQEAETLARKIARWCQDNLTQIKAADPEPPEYLNDRAADNWRSLLRIADVAGDEWAKTAREAIKLLGGEQDDDSDSIGAKLLVDIRSVFEDKQTDRLPSVDLVMALGEMEDRPWPEWKMGKPLTQNQLARLLKPFKIAPGKVRFGPASLQGYRLEQFKDAFSRYIPPFQSGTLEQSNRINSLDDSQSGTEDGNVPVQNEDKLLKDKECSNVPVQNPPSRDWRAERRIVI